MCVRLAAVLALVLLVGRRPNSISLYAAMTILDVALLMQVSSES